MISLSNSEKLLEISSYISSPFEFDDNLLVACSSGEILKFSDGQLKPEFKIAGEASCVVYDSQRKIFYVGDRTNRTIMAWAPGDNQPSYVVKDYEGVPLLGPYSIVLSKRTGNIIFTDCGSIERKFKDDPNRYGSVFLIDMQQQSIKPLAHKCLDKPTGLAQTADERVTYVCETGKNRILRMFYNTDGVVHTSIFHQFSGGYGPTALAISPSTGILFAGIFEFKNIADEGQLAVLNPNGDMIAKLKLNHTGPEITGLFFSRLNNNNAMLYMTENSSKPSCFRLLVEIAKKYEKKSNTSYRYLLK